MSGPKGTRAGREMLKYCELRIEVITNQCAAANDALNEKKAALEEAMDMHDKVKCIERDILKSKRADKPKETENSDDENPPA